MKQDLIIIGGSKFVCEVDLQRIDTDKFDVLAINRQPLNIKYAFFPIALKAAKPAQIVS